MRLFVRVFAFFAIINTLCGFDLLADGLFFEPSSRGTQVWSFAFTAFLGGWALYALGRDRD